MALRKPKLIFGDDNGECTLYDITVGEYELYLKRIDAAWDDDNDAKATKLEKELESHKIKVDNLKYENGYIPAYVGYIAEVYGMGTDSN